MLDLVVQVIGVVSFAVLQLHIVSGEKGWHRLQSICMMIIVGGTLRP